jgi:hypothetical protein
MPRADRDRQVRIGDPIRLEEGTCYLVEGKTVSAAYRFVERLHDDGTSALVISRLHPDRVRARFGLRDIPTWWLSQSPGDDHFDPTAVGTLASSIEAFSEGHPEGCIVLLDGIEYISMNVGFTKTMFFIEHLNEYAMTSRLTVLVPLDPECYEPKEVARLERFMETLEMSDLRGSSNTED